MASGTRTPRMGRPPLDELAAGERRARILREGSRLFAQRGYAAVSISEIAAAVRVTKAALYHYFPSKDELYAEIVCTGLEAIATAIGSVVELPLPLREKIERLTYTAIMEVRSDADLDAMMRDVAEHLTSAQRARVETARQALEAAYERLMRSGLARGELRELDPRLLAHAYAHLLAAFAGRVGVEAGFQGRQATVDAVVDLFLRGAGTATSLEGR